MVLIIKEAVQELVQEEMTAGKAVGLDGCAGECMKSSRATVTVGLVRLLNVCFEHYGANDWVSAYVVPL